MHGQITANGCNGLVGAGAVPRTSDPDAGACVGELRRLPVIINRTVAVPFGGTTHGSKQGFAFAYS